jgi:HSP20 family protein
MANIVRWDPFGETLSLRQAMDKLFEDAWVRPWHQAAQTGNGLNALALDIYETGDDIVVTAAVPGVKPEDLEITVQGDVLTIRGETKVDESVGDEKYHRRERGFGRFGRQVVLPMGVDSGRAEAQFEHGVLTLKLPKAEQAKERRIPITAGAASTNGVTVQS